MKLTLLGAVLAGALALPVAPAGATPALPVATAVRAAVTPGSYLTVVDTGQPNKEFGGIDPSSQSLVLVAPTGETRVVYTRAVKRFRTFFLSDWSVDGSTALLVSPNRDGADVIRVDVATGAAQVVHEPLLNNAVLDPAGAGFVATLFKGPNGNSILLDAVGWDGTHRRLRDNVSGTLLPGRGGTVLTTDGKHGRQQLLVSTTTGALVKQFHGAGYCNPIRWWDATRVLETCQQGDLYLVDPSTGADTQLTDGHGNGDYGHVDARYVGSRLYVQVAGACGYTYVAQVTKRRTKPVKVPGAVGNVIMVNTVGDDLVIEQAASCDGQAPRAELSLFDPQTKDETPLLRLTKKQAFEGVRVLGEVRAAAY